MEKFFNNLRELMNLYGEIKDEDFNAKEKNIKEDRWLKIFSCSDSISNSEYEIFFSLRLNKKGLKVNVKNISGKINFSKNEYKEDSIMGRVAKMILSDNRLQFIEADKYYRIGKLYQKEDFSMDSMKEAITSIVKAQYQIKSLEQELISELYQRSRLHVLDFPEKN